MSDKQLTDEEIRQALEEGRVIREELEKRTATMKVGPWKPCASCDRLKSDLAMVRAERDALRSRVDGAFAEMYEAGDERAKANNLAGQALVRAERAEADLARVTAERDALAQRIGDHTLRMVSEAAERDRAVAQLAQRDARIAVLEGALREIAKVGHGIEDSDPAEVLAEYWATAALRYRDLARAALAPNPEGRVEKLDGDDA